MMRVRINFDKTEEMRFTSHLDMYRTWERTLRRACLPLAYTQGYKPHPRLQIAAALPLGFTSSNDLIDLWLEQDIPISTIQACIEAALPPGIKLNSIHAVPINQPSLQALLMASEYRITFLEAITDLEQRVQTIIQKPSVITERKGKPRDLRPLILSIEIFLDSGSRHQGIQVLLKTDPANHARPDELILAMGIAPEKAVFHRQKLYFSQEIGASQS